MIRKPVPAIASALALSRSPRGGRPSAGERLPEGILALVRIVAGDEQALADARAETGEGTQLLREAASFYIEQVLFAKDASSYRVLGVDPDASDERIREHYRWLARWLHPDRNQDGWEVVFSERVSQAWQHMRTSDRRAGYDLSLSEAADMPATRAPSKAGAIHPAPMHAAPMHAPARAAVYEAPEQGGPSLRWLPKAIFASLGVLALGVVALFSIVKLTEDRGAEPLAAVPPTPISLVESAPEPPLPPEGALPPDLALDVEPSPVASSLEASAQLAEPAQASAMLPETVASADPAPPAPLPRVEEPVQPPAAPARSGKQPRTSEQASVAEVSAASVAAAAPRKGRRQPAEMPPPEPVEVAVADQAGASAVEAATESGANAGPKIGQRDANRLLNHFSQAYEDGDIEGMRGMFTADVQGPQGGLREILDEYEELFGSSSQRKLSVRDVNFFSSGDTLTIIASYSAVVTSNHKGKPRRTTGNLRLDLRREQEKWRVFRLRHDERQG